jgi:hypothetical protein
LKKIIFATLVLGAIAGCEMQNGPVSASRDRPAPAPEAPPAYGYSVSQAQAASREVDDLHEIRRALADAEKAHAAPSNSPPRADAVAMSVPPPPRFNPPGRGLDVPPVAIAQPTPASAVTKLAVSPPPDTRLSPTVPFAAGNQTLAKTTNVPTPATCAFDEKTLPAETVVLAAGGYSGKRLTFQLDQSGHEATQFDIGVHADKPVALLLSSYEPTVWSIGWTKGTRIVAVYTTGYHRQVVAGLPKSVPVLTATYDNKSPCGYNTLSNPSASGLAWLNPTSRKVFGKPVDRVYAKADNGFIDISESSRAKSEYVTSPDTPVSSFQDKNAPLAGKGGLDDAVAKGLIRPINEADLEKVRAAYRAQAIGQRSGNSMDVPPLAGAAPGATPPIRVPVSTRGYVVLKPFVYPAGLFGGNMSEFIIPKGVPTPSGNPGHSTVVNLNNGVSCSGPDCRQY